MSLRFALIAALTALPVIAQPAAATDPPAPAVPGAAPEIIWVDSFDDIPVPITQGCIGNISAAYCRGDDGQTYAVRSSRTPATTPAELPTQIVHQHQGQVGIALENAATGTAVEADSPTPPDAPFGTSCYCLPRLP